MIKIIDYYADWCGPCQKLKPVLKEIEEEFKGKVEIEYVNVDTEIDKAQDNGVSSLPTLVFEKDGKETNRITGLTTKGRITALIE